MPLTDVTNWIIAISFGQERVKKRICPGLIANVTDGGCALLGDQQGMGDNDGAAFPIAKKDATCLHGQILRGLGGDGLVGILA